MPQLNGIIPQEPIHQIVIMRREYRPAIHLRQLVNVSGGNGVSVVRRRAAAELVEQDERVAARVLQNNGGLGQLD